MVCLDGPFALVVVLGLALQVLEAIRVLVGVVSIFAFPAGHKGESRVVAVLKLEFAKLDFKLYIWESGQFHKIH